jgi:hypothetical protein
MEDMQEQQSSHELLIRLDERTKGMAAILATLPANYVAKNEFEPVKKVIEDLSTNYVSKEDFSPIQKGFYAVAGLICLSVISALVYSVVRSRG